MTPKQVIANLSDEEMSSATKGELENLRLAIIVEAADYGNYHEIEVAMYEALISQDIDIIPIFSKIYLILFLFWRSFIF